MSAIVVSTAVQEFLAFASGTVKPATWRLYSLYLTRFAEIHGQKPLDELTPSIVRSWGKTYHPVQAVQRMMSWAKCEARHIQTNPLEGMKKVRRGRRLRTLSPVESARLLRRSGREFRRVLLALRESIARPGEIRRVSWPDLRIAGLQPFTVADLVAGRAFFFLDDAKADALRDDRFAVRVIPVSRRLGRLLSRLFRRQSNAAGPVFLNRRGRAWTVNAVRCRFRRLRVAAGVVRDHRGENAVAYSLRHTGATRLVVAGVDLATIAAVMGHADVRMTARYVHLAPDHLSKAIGKLTEAKTAVRPKIGLPGSRRKRPDDLG